MATQSLTEENSDLSENEDVQEIEDPILVAVNAGASLRSPTSAVIARKRKLPANEGKYKQRGSSKTTPTARLLTLVKSAETLARD